MSTILTSTFAPTAMANMQLTKKAPDASRSTIKELSGGALRERLLKGVRAAE
jgi:hypothetical protein